MAIKKIKGGAWGADIEGVGKVELHFKRPTGVDRMRLAPLVGRSSEQIYTYWATYEEIHAEVNAAADAQDEQRQLAALQRLRDLAGLLDPDLWERVGEQLAQYCTCASLDEEKCADADERAELIGYLAPTDLHLAFQALYKAEDGLSAEEGKPSAPTSTT